MATPSRDELVEAAMAVHDAARDYERTFTNKRGEVTSYPQPDFRAQLEALKFVAVLLGYTGDLSKMDIEAVKRELERLGKRVVEDKPS